MSMNPFRPVKGSTQNINAIATSARVKLLTSSGGTLQVRIYNSTTATIWVAHGDNTVTADLTTSQPFGPGVTEVQTWGVPDTGDLYVAAIAVATPGQIYFTPGAGI